MKIFRHSNNYDIKRWIETVGRASETTKILLANLIEVLNSYNQDELLEILSYGLTIKDITKLEDGDNLEEVVKEVTTQLTWFTNRSLINIIESNGSLTLSFGQDKPYNLLTTLKYINEHTTE